MKKDMIGIIDYKAGNAPSVLNAFKKLGKPAERVSKPEEIAEAAALVLPGVGAAKATMENLRETGIAEALYRQVIEGKKPFLGICVGLQILFEYSEEESTECLGWLRGSVVKFPKSMRVPQMGWNKADFQFKDPLTENTGGSGYFYFVNSYYAVPGDESAVLGITEYGQNFCSMVRKGNIAASQFHLEKSGPSGLRVLQNFASYALM
ncbi:MAG: imidazole glycerol phosphate synthase subunit HisH [Oscillospiraceae bacterium]|nr:imidazole glycerol phosphate synthase subunit HisH [Oscillospiraceae bacterium]